MTAPGVRPLRLPEPKDLWSAYAVIVGLVYSWSVVISLYMLPSWRFYLYPGEIVSIYAYTFCVDFLESLLFLALILGLEFTIFRFLPGPSDFVPRSAITVILVLGAAALRLLLYKPSGDLGDFQTGELSYWALTVIAGGLLILAVRRVPPVSAGLGRIADRATVFLLLYLPLTLGAVLLLIARRFWPAW